PLLAAAVRAIRSGDVAAGGAPPRPRRPVPAAPGGPPPRTPAADTLAVLRAAARHGTTVRIGHVDADGTAGERVVEPVRVEGGFVTAYDHTAEEVRTYPLHRVTGAAPLTDTDG
ncbi:WYL domain-containing protein, partial [Streptomyces sp. S1A]|uniref:WYL domain-containing protein n=1 Tax=Streptomyces sp. ICN903 TaxID=2964654 RepID=UPI001EDB5C77|nr:WYL domain-containing protein [Streptomyces sp. ICN903]